MNKSPSTFSWLKLATVLLPIIGVMAAIFLVFLQWNKLNSLKEQKEKTEQQLAVLNRLSLEIKAKPTLSKVAVVPPTYDEQSQFLNMIRGFAEKSRVRLVRYNNRYIPPPPPDSAEAKKPTLPPGVMALNSEVEVAGDYNSIRQFMYQLLHAPRLYNTVDLKWNRGTTNEKWPLTHLGFTLLRYVAVPIPPPTKPTGDAAPAGNS